MPYFVKFVPYNENALSALINKTIKFSTVYEFNDFNELGFLGTQSAPFGEDFNEKLESEIKEKFHDIEFREKSYKNALEFGHYNKNDLEQFKSRLNDYSPKNPHVFNKDKDYPIIEAYLAFSSVGIFCASALDVFCDDSAQLMFAHYSGNLKGLTLIYEVSSEKHNFSKIMYPDCEDEKKSSSNECLAKMKPASGGEGGRLFKWVKGDYSNMDDFLNKSKKWKYENEHRLFARPGIVKAGNHNIKLKAILYTSRFPHDIETLKSINENIYKDTLIVQAIGPSNSHYKFIINDDGASNGQCVRNWLSEKLESKPPKTT